MRVSLFGAETINLENDWLLLFTLERKSEEARKTHSTRRRIGTVFFPMEATSYRYELVSCEEG
jgi:hypothetical protein